MGFKRIKELHFEPRKKIFILAIAPLLIVALSLFFFQMTVADGFHKLFNMISKNRLAGEKSPYLLQHADNPVDWYPWGDEAFKKAKEQDKPIFLSIGYSTCHWCHVMEHESFEDEEVAALLNDTFICIKVDREERPDIDHIYMAVAQMMTGRGGWPLTILMTPEKKPFFAATYIPRESGIRGEGLLDLIPRVKKLWQTRRQEIRMSSEKISLYLLKNKNNSPGKELQKNILKIAYKQLSDSFDEVNGGFRVAPKFPTPHNFLFLLRYWKSTGKTRALEMVEKSLLALRRGGIYDHLGFGFHRYSTDERWFLPHFEKMLYDQAMLTLAYAETYQATHKNIYKETAVEILTYVLRDMTAQTGAFYSAEDADSEGEEGKFYQWTWAEIEGNLTEKEASLVKRMFNLKSEGNYKEEADKQKTGRNVFYLSKIPDQEEKNAFESIRKKLFQIRKNRIHPQKDDKILTDWNGLMIAALAKSSRIFEMPHLADAAAKGAKFILKNMRTAGGRLFHRYRDGSAAIPGNIDDYAFFIWGLLELYETTFDISFLRAALQLNDTAIKHFWDSENGAFFFTPDDGEKLLMRNKEIYDGAIPSGNSIAMLNLLRLGRITANMDLEKKAAQISRTFSARIMQAPDAFTQIMVAINFSFGPAYEIVIAGQPDAVDTREMLRALRNEYIPNKVVLFRSEKSPDIVPFAEYTRHQKSLKGKATAYICQNYTCNYPVSEIKKMLKLLRINRK